MPEIHNKSIFSFSSEDSNFPAKNLLETRFTKKWKCQEVGEKSCFVVFKLDKPRLISGIDIGNEHSAFIGVLVGDSKQDPPVFKEILLSTSFMTITEAKNGTNPHRVRCFERSSLVESVAKQQWDLVKVLCSQPFDGRIKYGLSFVNLKTPDQVSTDISPMKVHQESKIEESGEKKKKFGKFLIRNNSDSDSDDAKNTSGNFSRWKNSKSGESSEKPKSSSIKDQIKVKLEENRKRIRKITDSSEEETVKKPKPNRNRLAGLVYEDEDDNPNEKLQKKLDKDREKEVKPKPKVQLKAPEKSSDKFASFVSDDDPSSAPRKSSSKTDFSSEKKKSPEKAKSQSKPTPASAKKVSYKPFNKLLEGVVFVFSGYVNPERGILRQKALDMGAKYKPDWDNNCTHLICAYANTPKYQQVRGKAKVVTKKWIEACFADQKKISWRRYALDSNDKNEPESEEEIHNVLSKKEESKRKVSESGSDDDMMVVDRRAKTNGSSAENKKSDSQPTVDDDVMEVSISPPKPKDVMEVSTDDDKSSVDLNLVENQVYLNKKFYLNSDLSATDVLKLKNQIASMSGKITSNPSHAHYIITSTGKNLPAGLKGEVLTSLWIFECHEMEAFIPINRYKLK